MRMSRVFQASVLFGLVAVPVSAQIQPGLIADAPPPSISRAVTPTQPAILRPVPVARTKFGALQFHKPDRRFEQKRSPLVFHQTADKKYWTMVGIQVAADVFDTETSQYCFHHVPGCTELVWPYSRNRAAEYSISLSTTALWAMEMYWQKRDAPVGRIPGRRYHHSLFPNWWEVGLIYPALKFGAGIHNLVLITSH